MKFCPKCVTKNKVNLVLLGVNALLIDFSLFFYWLVTPLLLKSLGGNPLTIGLANAVPFGLSGLVAPLSGFISDKFRPEISCEFGIVFHSFSCVLTGLVYITSKTTWYIYVILILQGIGYGLYASPIQNLVTKESYKGDENKNFSRFSLYICIGKAIGFFCGGLVTDSLSFTYSYYIACFLAFVAFIMFPRQPTNVNEENNTKEIEMTNIRLPTITVQPMNQRVRMNKYEENTYMNSKPRKILFYIGAMVINISCYGCIAILSNQYIDFADDNHIILRKVVTSPSTYVGVYLFLVNIVEMLGFIIMGHWNGWQYNMLYNVIIIVMMFYSSISLSFMTEGWAILSTTIPIGLVAACEFQGTLYYSTHTTKNSGKLLGISELVSEATYCILPVLSGYLSSNHGKEWTNYLCMIISFSGGVILILMYIANTILEHNNCAKTKVKQSENPDTKSSVSDTAKSIESDSSESIDEIDNTGLFNQLNNAQGPADPIDLHQPIN